MSGHSKWATIHRKKGLIDAERGKVFQKLAKEIYVAARGTDGNPDTNPGLRLVIEKAKSQNMPKDNINKAIEKATGGKDSENYEQVVYEGYGPSGVSIMVDCLTDNKNRTATFVRSTFTKRGGNLGTTGSVSYMFKRKGVIVFETTKLTEDEGMLIALDNVANDVLYDANTFEIYTEPDKFIAVKEAFINEGINDFITSEVTLVPDNYIKLDEEMKEKVTTLIEALEDIDDVQNVYHNLKI